MKIGIVGAGTMGHVVKQYIDEMKEQGKDVCCLGTAELIGGRTLEEADRILYGKATWKSWKNQDYFLIGRKTDYSLFTKTDMYLWYGIKGTVDKKLSANLDQ